MTLKIALAGGGTAGHVNPLLATASVLISRGHEVSVIGTDEGLEARLVPEAGIPLTKIPRVPLPRYPSPKAFAMPRKLLRAVSISRGVLEQADALVGFGGYVAAPAYFAAARMNKPFVVQEQNVMPGIANKVGARWASAVSLAFPQTPLQAKHGETVFTGMPLRRQIMDLAGERSTDAGRQLAKEAAAQRLGLDPAHPTLLVMGGSLGAAHLNEVMVKASERGAFDRYPNVQVLHLTGIGKSDEVLVAAGAQEITWRAWEYMEDVSDLLAASDLVVCRSGAGTVAEVGVLGLPAVYVPLPIGNGEQTKNAEQQIAAGGALLVPNADFQVSTVTEQVLPLLSDQSRLADMGRANRGTSPGDGAKLLADLVEKYAERNRRNDN